MINRNLVVKGIKAIIPDGISDIDFSIVSGIDRISAKEIMSLLVQNGIGKWKNDSVFFHESDKLKTAFFAISNGSPIEEVSEYLNWKDFEALVSQILSENGFYVEKNVILTKPRMEIDVIGKKLNVEILIDCKHWKRMNESVLNDVVNKQVNRVKRYVNDIGQIIAVPAIVTLHQEQIAFINKVPIIPVTQLSSFLDELYGNLDQINTIEK
ncbi:MAG TPA: restriction endonuclease [Candidatus Nitrosopelagicus sp.]|nr:restriction endonuclease [Candidatus Nitrosopelagicus sp.]